MSKPRTAPGDPIYTRPDWASARRHWLHQQQPCARCGHPINYTPGASGPDSLDIGHILSKHHARAAGWTDGQINSLQNTQPEHRRCNRSHGARMGNQLRGRARPPFASSRAW
jgi:hypothetical protein